jgi:CRISPR/Cas system-associated protein endoribonuclease Cas2
MAYIIENANMYKHETIERVSLLVDKNRILSVKPSFNRYNYMKMNANPFIMTPTHVYMDVDTAIKVDDSQKKTYIIKKFLMKGCTTVLAVTSIKYDHQLEEKLVNTRNFFNGTPLDFVVAVKIPFSKLNPTFIRKCKKEKIPAIFVELNQEDELALEKTAWTWMKDALFPYNCPLIPVIHTVNHPSLLQTWNNILKREKVPYVDKILTENEPIPLDVLKKIGIYPLKGYLQTGGELSYNLYYPDEGEIFDLEINDKEFSLMITVHKGKIIRVKNKVHYDNDQGEELKISRPSFFS